ncbi:hypothetical protein V5O48_015915 [Marasmius crinis-equi]|uniref:Uncharacterized protein n=1 Tax=Marasmius crinis-equi TaxID=585013 RepID=A0ABR3ET93_9AGAR
MSDTSTVVYNTTRPEITQQLYPLADVEVQKVRATYPEPFSENDPCEYRRPNSQNKTGNGVGIGSPVGLPGGPGGSDSGNSKGGDDRRDNQPPIRNNGNRGAPGGPPGGGGPPSDPDDPYFDNDDDFELESERGDTRDQRKGVCYTSVDPTLTNKKTWNHDPTPLSEDEMMKATFKILEDLIVLQLYCEPVANSSTVQKTLLQSLPRPSEYFGDDDYTIFES